MKIALLGIALLLAVCTAPRASGRQQPPAPRQLDAGRYEGGTYVNGFFGLSFTPPPWVETSAAEKERIDRDVKSMTAAEDERQRAKIEDSVARSRLLFSMSKLPPGTPANAVLMLVAERLPSPAVKTPADVFRLFEAGFRSTQFRVEFESAPRDVRLGGAAFGVATIKADSPYGLFRQRIYVTVRKGYSLQFFFTYLDDADLPAFEAAMKTVVIK